MKRHLIITILSLLSIPLVLLFLLSIYTISEGEQAIVTEFGRPVKEVFEAGVKFKKPFIQKVNRIERRVLEWDGKVNEMPTRDKVFIIVDTYGRWRIKDPLQYFQRLRDETTAQSRLDDILASETRNTIARHDLIEVVRSTKGRKPQIDTSLVEMLGDDVVEAPPGENGEPAIDEGSGPDQDPEGEEGIPAPLAEGSSPLGLPTLYPIERGRIELEQDIFEAAAPKLEEFGIELLDVRFKRVNYSQEVSESIYSRMISERNQIAERFRSQGQGSAARIIGEKERELRRIQSEAYRTVQEIRGAADAEATNIFARAYDRSEATREFYLFSRTLEAYGDMFDGQTTVVFSTDSPLFSLFKELDPAPTDMIEGDPEDVGELLQPVDMEEMSLPTLDDEERSGATEEDGPEVPLIEEVPELEGTDGEAGGSDAEVEEVPAGAGKSGEQP